LFALVQLRLCECRPAHQQCRIANPNSFHSSTPRDVILEAYQTDDTGHFGQSQGMETVAEFHDESIDPGLLTLGGHVLASRILSRPLYFGNVAPTQTPHLGHYSAQIAHCSDADSAIMPRQCQLGIARCHHPRAARARRRVGEAFVLPGSVSVVSGVFGGRRALRCDIGNCCSATHGREPPHPALQPARQYGSPPMKRWIRTVPSK
jgi:hypothetical protein